MSFVGPVNRLGDAFLRPHDIQILPERRRRPEALVAASCTSASRCASS